MSFWSILIVGFIFIMYSMCIKICCLKIYHQYPEKETGVLIFLVVLTPTFIVPATPLCSVIHTVFNFLHTCIYFPEINFLLFLCRMVEIIS